MSDNPCADLPEAKLVRPTNPDGSCRICGARDECVHVRVKRLTWPLAWPNGEPMSVREWFVHRLPYSTTVAFFGQRLLVLRSGRRLFFGRVRRGWRLP